MSKVIYIKYNEATSLLEEADVLLFKAGDWPSVGWWISNYTQSPYSHTGLASKINEDWFCIEFREFIGSRQYPLEQYVKENPGKIDVFRVYQVLTWAKTIQFDNGIFYTSYLTKRFNNQTANNITEEAKKLIGKKYSWWTIWKMAKGFLPFIRLHQHIKYENNTDVAAFVCSTLVTYSFRKHFLDPVPNLPDDYTRPGDLARSSAFAYQFTLVP